MATVASHGNCGSPLGSPQGVIHPLFLSKGQVPELGYSTLHQIFYLQRLDQSHVWHWIPKQGLGCGGSVVQRPLPGLLLPFLPPKGARITACTAASEIHPLSPLNHPMHDPILPQTAHSLSCHILTCSSTGPFHQSSCSMEQLCILCSSAPELTAADFNICYHESPIRLGHVNIILWIPLLGGCCSSHL